MVGPPEYEIRHPGDEYPARSRSASASLLGKDRVARLSFIQVRRAIAPDLPSLHHNELEVAIAKETRQFSHDGAMPMALGRQAALGRSLSFPTPFGYALVLVLQQDLDS